MNTIELAQSTPGWSGYAMATCLKVSLDWAVLWIFNGMVRVHAGSSSYSAFGLSISLQSLIFLWFVCRVLSKIATDMYYVRIKLSFDKNIVLTFREQALQGYQALNFPTRKIETLSTYLPRFRNAVSYIRLLCGMGVQSLLSLLRSMFDVLVALRDVCVLQYAVVFSLVAMFYLLSQKAEKLNKLQRHRRNLEENVTNSIKMEEPYFEMGKRDRRGLMQLHRRFADLITPVLDMQHEYSSVISFGEEAMVLMIVIFHARLGSPELNIINMLRSVVAMSHAFNNCSKFHRKYIEEESNMAKYVDFWSNNEHNKIEEVKKIGWPGNLTCLEINFRRCDPEYVLRLRAPFVLPRGAKVLLRGDTGSGKSTLCELIQGRDVVSDSQSPSLVFEEGNQRSFAHHISECIQDVSTVVKWDTSTVREHFDGELEDGIIMKFCELAQIEDKVATLGFDSRINKRLSGGEMQRITLAANLHYNYKYAVSFMIFDEPEKGLGKAAAKIISNILDCGEYRNTTMLISTHHDSLKMASFTHLMEIKKVQNCSTVYVSVLL